MDSVNLFDVIVLSFIVILGLKGFMSGFLKEAFGLLGIGGGVYFGSRYGSEFGVWISENIFALQNPNTTVLVGFISILMIFWIAMIVMGGLFASMMKLSGLGGADRPLGFLFGSGKIFVISSIIVYALMNINIVRAKLSKYIENSFMVPIFEEVGSRILKLDFPETPSVLTGVDSNKSDGRMGIGF